MITDVTIDPGCEVNCNSSQHGSLEGVGGLKTNEAYHSKADALLIPEMYFFENLPTPFFGNVCFIKFGSFSALLALPVMIREEYGQMAHQTLSNILLSDASLVTKSYIARFVADDAFNPSALSNCSTGPSPPLAHGLNASSSTNRAMHDFVTMLALLSRMLGSV